MLANNSTLVARGLGDQHVDRLYVLNAERAREEQRLGLGKRPRVGRDEGGGEAPRPPKPGRAKKTPGKQGDLF